MPIAITYDGGHRPRRPGHAAERLPDRADEPRDRVPPRRVHDPEGAEDRRCSTTTAPTARRARPTSRSAFSANPRVGGDQDDAPGRRDRPLRRRSCARAARARRRCSSGGSRPTIAAVLTAARSIGLERSRLHPADGRGPAHPPAARRPPGLGRRPHVRLRPDDRGGRGRLRSRASSRSTRRTYGADKVGVKNSKGKQVVQPPEFAMYPYDFVNVLVAALTKAGSVDPHKVQAALNQVTTQGANGDERGFNEHNHEGVVDDDVYFARFHDMTYSPGPGRPALVDAADDPADALSREASRPDRGRAWRARARRCGGRAAAEPAGRASRARALSDREPACDGNAALPRSYLALRLSIASADRVLVGVDPSGGRCASTFASGCSSRARATTSSRSAGRSRTSAPRRARSRSRACASTRCSGPGSRPGGRCSPPT